MLKILSVAILIFTMFTATGHAKDIDEILYCNKYYNQYRQIAYWARVIVSIEDFDTDTGAAEYLKLKFKKDKTDYFGKVSKDIKDFYHKEFQRIIKGSLPYHDVNTGYEQRLSEYLKKNGNLDVIDGFQAYEQARMRSLFGKNPAAVYCNIRISRTDFPVLYVIKTSVVANEELTDYGVSKISKESIGYSSPEFIAGELKKMMTEHLIELSEVMKKIRACNNNK